MLPLVFIGRALPPRESTSSRPDWAQADPARIARMLQRALARPTGGWYVLDATDRIGERRARGFLVEGLRLVAWRRDGQLWAAPASCPHMGASLEGACVQGGRLVCPWHGLRLGPEGRGNWKPLPTHDDGVLAWVRLDQPGEVSSDRPVLPSRPASPTLIGVIRRDARCAPADVIANRLDPWHGVHFHPHSFARLRVVDEADDHITVRVAYRALGPLVVEVDARFETPSARCIVMTIERGEGEGSVVETHATPLEPGRTAIVEATIATSDRPGFRLLQPLRALLRRFIEKRAERLWIDDAAYCERLAYLRTARPKSSAEASHSQDAHHGIGRAADHDERERTAPA
ncbi:MAG: Rieske (2Fe-2S) protein [Myxococcota bacterium]|nr:Rieske (2Fe-2S) protein [Myxococcota bacterium]MDW8362102.1 DUF5914 domain-containing protein [Myxococcales bacterium]